MHNDHISPDKEYLDARYVILICSVASLGGFLFGYDTAVISGAIGPLATYFQLSASATGWAVSNVVLGCIIGALGAGWVADRLGRKKTLILAALLFTASALFSAIAEQFASFVFWRWIGGLAVGIASTVSPMYMSEVSPPAIRGRALSMQQLSLSIGMVIAYVANYVIAKGSAGVWLETLGWRWMLASETIPCLLFLLTVFLIPESPRWQVARGQVTQALGTLTRISGASQAKSLAQSIRDSLDEPSSKSAFSSGFRPVLSDPRSRYIILVGCAIAVLQQLSGINVIMYYGPMLLENFTGGDTTLALLHTAALGTVLLVGVVISLNFIDRWGRRPLLRWGSLGCALSLLVSATAFYFQNQTSLIALCGLFAFMLIYGLSWSLGTWTLIGEIFPNRIRALAMGLAIGALWVSNFIISQTFPWINQNAWLQSTFNGAAPLAFFALFCILAWWFIGRFLPETRGIPLERMEHHMLSHSRKYGHQSDATNTGDGPKWGEKRYS